MTRYQLRFADSFPDEVLEKVQKGIESRRVSLQLASIALLAPEDDGAFNTERLVITTRDVKPDELPTIKRALRRIPVLKRRGVTLETYEVLEQHAISALGLTNRRAPERRDGRDRRAFGH